MLAIRRPGNVQTAITVLGRFLDAPTALIRKMNHRARRREDLYYVRIWVETVDRPDEWRGMVTHVGTGERHYFTKFSDLEAFLRCPRPLLPNGG
jgi:hypothetical protein